MSDMISLIGDFSTRVLIPFIENFFTANIGFIFVATIVVIVVLGGLANLFKTKF